MEPKIFTRIGVDEVGRGCFAGPIVACAVLFPYGSPIIKGIEDSKMLTREQREELDKEIRKHAIIAISCRSANIINQIGINWANQQVLRDSAGRLIKHIVDMDRYCILVDGKFKIGNFPFRQQAIIKGDQKVYEIGAASIVAKVFRDRLMAKLEQKYPQFKFSKHAGYGTKEHIEEIKKFGKIPGIHRDKFIHFECGIYGNNI